MINSPSIPINPNLSTSKRAQRRLKHQKSMGQISESGEAISQVITKVVMRELNPLKISNIKSPKYIDKIIERVYKLNKLTAPKNTKEKTIQRVKVKSEVQSFVAEHSRCGLNCRHLIRFYERVNDVLEISEKKRRNRNMFEYNTNKIDLSNTFKSNLE